MLNKIFVYKDYFVEISNKDNAYTISKYDKIVVSCPQTFPFPTDAEIHAKLYIDRLIGTKNGWTIS